jgi:hypothetical protein
LHRVSDRHKAATYTKTYMPRLRIEHRTPAFEEAKTIHNIDRAATVIGKIYMHVTNTLYLNAKYVKIAQRI